jgi:hypothetical protein
MTDAAERAIVDALARQDTRLRELGHAHAHLDANARHLIARTAIEALQAHALPAEVWVLDRVGHDCRGEIRQTRGARGRYVSAGGEA